MKKLIKDSHENLSLKSILAWNFVINYCDHAQYIAKLNDNTVPNMFALLEFVNYLTRISLNLSANKFFCELLFKVEVKRSEFKITCDQYNKKYFNPYCTGVVNIFRTDLIPKLYKSALKMNYSFMNDIYVGLLTELLDLNMVPINKYIVNERERNQKDFLFYRSINGIENLFKIWNLIVQKHEFPLNVNKNLDFFQDIIIY